MSQFLFLLTTVPDEKTGQKIARLAVEQRLAACATLSGRVASTYWWEGEITQDQEFQLFLKTQDVHFPQLEKLIQENHPYEVPEIICLPVLKGHKPYLDWIEKETSR